MANSGFWRRAGHDRRGPVCAHVAGIAGGLEGLERRVHLSAYVAEDVASGLGLDVPLREFQAPAGVVAETFGRTLAAERVTVNPESDAPAIAGPLAGVVAPGGDGMRLFGRAEDGTPVELHWRVGDGAVWNAIDLPAAAGL